MEPGTCNLAGCISGTGCTGLSLQSTDKSRATLFSFYVDHIPDTFIKLAHISFSAKEAATPFNAAIFLWETEIKCDLNEDGYAPVKGVEWTTPTLSQNDKFRTPEISSLVQYAVDRRKLLRSDFDKLQLSFIFTVQNPRTSSTDRMLKVFTTDINLFIYYEESGQSKLFVIIILIIDSGQSERVCFVNSALKILCNIVKNTLLYRLLFWRFCPLECTNKIVVIMIFPIFYNQKWKQCGLDRKTLNKYIPFFSRKPFLFKHNSDCLIQYGLRHL